MHQNDNKPRLEVSLSLLPGRAVRGSQPTRNYPVQMPLGHLPPWALAECKAKSRDVTEATVTTSRNRAGKYDYHRRNLRPRHRHIPLAGTGVSMVGY